MEAQVSWETRGVGNTGSDGKHLAWKTRGLVENTGTQCKEKHGVKVKKNMGNHYFVEQNQNFVILNCIENHLT